MRIKTIRIIVLLTLICVIALPQYVFASGYNWQRTRHKHVPEYGSFNDKNHSINKSRLYYKAPPKYGSFNNHRHTHRTTSSSFLNNHYKTDSWVDRIEYPERVWNIERLKRDNE